MCQICADKYRYLKKTLNRKRINTLFGNIHSKFSFFLLTVNKICIKLLLLTALTTYTVTSLHVTSFTKKPVSSLEFPTSCKDVQYHGHNVTGFYFIQPTNAPEPFLVLCNMNSSGGGWTTILNRVDGSQSFYMNWDSYKHGFGNLGGEFWLGLEKIYYLTRYEVNEMLFELVDWENGQEDAHYDYFSIGSEEEKYILKLVGGFTGSVGDGFTDQAGMKFSTPDKDRDVIETNCAAIAKGGWWFRSCKLANPTGLYIVGGNMSDDLSGITWYPWHGSHYSLKEVRMMIRPKE